MDTMNDHSAASFPGTRRGDATDAPARTDHDGVGPDPAVTPRADDALVEYVPRRPVFCSR